MKYTTLHIQSLYGFILLLGCLLSCGLDRSNYRSLRIDSAEISVINCKQKEIDTQGMMCKPIDLCVE